MSLEKSFTFKKQSLEDVGGPVAVLGVQNEMEKMSASSSSSRGSADGKNGGKGVAFVTGPSKRKLDRENDPTGGKSQKKREKRAKKIVAKSESQDSESESESEEEDDDETVPAARRVKEVGSGKVVDGRVKNIRGINQPIEPMVDSTDLFKKADYAALYARYSEQGYVFLRDVLPRAEVLKANKRVLKHLMKTGAADESGRIQSGHSKGWAVQASNGELVLGRNPHPRGSAQAEAYVEAWRHTSLDKSVQQVLNGEALNKVVEALCRGRQAALKLPEDKPAYSPLVLNPFFTWLRVKGQKDTTIEHADYYYWLRETDLFISVGDATMYNVEGEKEESKDPSEIECVVCKSTEDEEGNEILLCDECDYGIHLQCKKPPLKHLPKGSFFCPGCHPRPMMGTAYIPFQDLSLSHSVPCVLPGSHRFSEFDKTLRSDGDVPAAFYKDEGRRRAWHVPSSYKAGDVLLLDLRTIQAGTRSQTNRFGISCDTRFYLKPERANWGKTPSTRFVKAAAENRLVWKGERVKEFGEKKVMVGDDDDEEEDEEVEEMEVEEKKPKERKAKKEKKKQVPPPQVKPQEVQQAQEEEEEEEDQAKEEEPAEKVVEGKGAEADEEAEAEKTEEAPDAAVEEAARMEEGQDEPEQMQEEEVVEVEEAVVEVEVDEEEAGEMEVEAEVVLVVDKADEQQLEAVAEKGDGEGGEEEEEEEEVAGAAKEVEGEGAGGEEVAGGVVEMEEVEADKAGQEGAAMAADEEDSDETDEGDLLELEADAVLG